MESCTLCCLNIVLGIACLVVGALILKKLAVVIRMLEQPVARKLTPELKARFGMRSQREAQREGARADRNGNEQRNDRGDRGDRRDRNEQRNDRGERRDRGDRRDRRDRGERRRNRYEAPSAADVMGNDAEAPAAPAAEAPAAEARPQQSERPALAPRGGDRQAEAQSAPAAPAAEAPAAPAAEAPAAPAELRFGRRQQVKRPPEIQD